MKILVIEDELLLMESIIGFLEKEAYVVASAINFDEAYSKIGIYEYDCILLDIMLPGGSGLALLKEIKLKGYLSNVIIISAKNALDDKIQGLELGADDYLTKPFHLAELNARIKAVLRRKQQEGKDELTFLNTTLNLKEHTLIINGKNVPINRKEFDILYFFLLNKTRLVTKTSLAEHVWGDDADQSNNFDFLYSQIKNIRKKLESADCQLEIVAIYGIGYKLQEK